MWGAFPALLKKGFALYNPKRSETTCKAKPCDVASGVQGSAKLTQFVAGLSPLIRGRSPLVLPPACLVVCHYVLL